MANTSIYAKRIFDVVTYYILYTPTPTATVVGRNTGTLHRRNCGLI